MNFDAVNAAGEGTYRGLLEEKGGIYLISNDVPMSPTTPETSDPNE